MKKYYARNIDIHLFDWKNSKRHKPLLLRGARQVGKSSAIRHLSTYFDYFIEVNFERDPELIPIFNGNLNPREIASRLSAFYGIPIIPDKTLLFFDEIQACPAAIHSLWFFYEDYPELHLVAAGSLLEFTLKNMKSFGVGRVRSLFMYPMSFDEFLVASGNKSWLESKLNASPANPLFEALHNKLVESFRTFLIVGGMPESVAAWIESKDYLQCQQIQDDIIQAYVDDFSKYEEKVDPILLRKTLQSIALQIGNKFVYHNVSGDYRTNKVRSALELLKDAGLIIPVIYTAANGIPLGAEINEKFTKYLFIDNGLLLRLLNMESSGISEMTQLLLISTASELVNKGCLTEMVAGLELLKYDIPSLRHVLYFWQNLNRSALAEVDYVVTHNMSIVPIEIKVGISGSMKSLFQMINTKHLSSGIRSSLENFGQLEKIDIIPLYALSNLFVNTP